MRGLCYDRARMAAPVFTYPDLPIARHRREIADALRAHRVLVVVGETGSGKTTQLPKIALEVAGDKPGILGCTQPRRIAAAAVARRLAEETKSELGGYVGYQVRFDDRTGPETRLKLMTDGILLAETQDDRDLRRYHTIILDEAHERSLNIDFLLGYMKLLLARRRDLKLIISSATLDAGGFSEFFDNAPVIHVAGRTYPVDVHYLPALNEREDLPNHVSRAVRTLGEVDARGDILVFLPGEREIRETAEQLQGERLPHTAVLPLFARLGLADQQRIFHPTPGERRIVLATNVAETSLTIPGIVYVIDSGLARMSRYSPARQIQRLQIEDISQASARQRMGRCGRVCEGVCLRLYGEESWDERPVFTDPEIRRSALAGVILRMADLRLPPLAEFPLPDPPSPKLVNEGYRTLREIGAIDAKKELTPIGRQLARLPIDPRLGRMILEARREHAVAELLVIVSGLSVMDPRERPSEAAAKADAAHAQWRHEESDFLGLLELWRASLAWKEGRSWKRNRLRKWCSENFLNMARILEWHNLHEDLARLLAREWNAKLLPLAAADKQAAPAAVHRCILAGSPLQFGVWKPEEKIYRGAGGRSFGIFPGSGLFRRKKRAEWIMGLELVETTRLWMRRAAALNPEWVEQAAPQLCAHHAYDAAWDKAGGAVYAKERVTCGGLTLIDGRRVHFGRFNPAAAREIMIREGLLQDGLRERPPFLEHLEALKEDLGLLESKLRRRNQIWCEDGAFSFFDRVIPQDICTEKALRQWREKEEKRNPELLFVPREEVMYHLGGEDADKLPLFPDTLEHDGVEYAVYYNDDPGSADDGVTIGVHIEQWPAFPSWLASWGVPGNLAERAECLLRTLPKDVKTFLQPIAQSARAFAEEAMQNEPEASLEETLAAFVARKAGKHCAPSQFDTSKMPPEFVVKIWVCGDDGEELAFGSDYGALQSRLQKHLARQFDRAAARTFSTSPMTRWDCGALPAQVPLGASTGYPALRADAGRVRVHVYANEREAAHAHRLGVLQLAVLRHGDIIARYKKGLKLGLEGKLALASLGPEPKGNLDDLVLAAADGALPSPRPRDPEAFDTACRELAAGMASTLPVVAALWEKLAAADRAVRLFRLTANGERHRSAVAEDLDRQLAWLLRPHRFTDTGFARLRDVERFVRGIHERLRRLQQQPIVRELERIALFREAAGPFEDAWKPRAREAAWVDYGMMVEEYRLAVFAPELAAKGRSSAKKLAAAFPG